MNQKKLVILLSCIAGGIVILGVVIALLLSPITSFLHGGTGDDFRNVGSCAGKTTEPEANVPDNVFITPGPDETPHADVTPSNPEQQSAQPTEIATPEPTIDPYEALYERADTSMMKDIVNVLLVGVDYSTERETWNGKKEWHSDVMMVLAVNFEENRADLISLPRDTYAQIPNVKGIYKLNASLNCGGGLYKDDGSFNPKGLEKVCEAAEWMLGGIEINYYYAVTMTSLKDLVDLCGGLDYDMDIAFKIQGRSYQKGMQHVDGQGFLDYCRVRKGVNGLPANEQGDANRVNRQKRMLIALFRQMQADKLITKIPDLLETFDGDLFTNCTTGQTAALAAFAYKLNADNIGMYSMSGSTTSLFQWNFCFTDQSNRVKIIQDVYGVSAKQYGQYTLKYARYRWCDMLYEHYMELLNPLTKYVQKLIDEDDKLP
ncbi:MAG: LCP family protein, partial [Clostridia bacterium]|nr:LCP family protein [Clostridia bacterium]